MKKLVFLVLLAFFAFLGTETVLAVNPSLPGCSAESLRFFPQGKIESLIGPATMMGNGDEVCVYQGAGKYFNGAFGTVLDNATMEASYDFYVRQNPGSAYTGKSCDRYVVSNADGQAGITAQKDSYLFIVAASLDAQQIIDAVEYACSQVAGSSYTETIERPAYGGTTKTENSNNSGPSSLITLFLPMLIPILIGGLVLIGLALVLWSLMRGKKTTYQVPTNMMPPQSPVPPPTFQPRVGPSMPNPMPPAQNPPPSWPPRQ